MLLLDYILENIISVFLLQYYIFIQCATFDFFLHK